MLKVLACSLVILQLSSIISAQGRNIALNQTASQFDTLDFSGFTWTADKAVDNCTLQDDPDNQQSCSSSQGTTDNFWRVDFDQPYEINSIVVFGRDSSSSTQTKDFRVAIVTDMGAQEELYDNSCCEYGNGIFTIPVADRTVSAVIITRPTESLLTLCEVQVFEVEPVVTTATPSTMVTMTTGDPGSIDQNTTLTNQNETTSTGPGQPSSMTSTTGMPSSAPKTGTYGEMFKLLLLYVACLCIYL